jgi:hypothetical protein
MEPSQVPMRHRCGVRIGSIGSHAHVKEDVGAGRQPAHGGGRPAVAGIGEDAPGRLHPVRVAYEIGLHVRHLCEADAPPRALDDIVDAELDDGRVRQRSRPGAATHPVDAKAGGVIAPRLEIIGESSLRTEQTVNETLQSGRAVDPHRRHAARTEIPPVQIQADEIDAVIVVEMGEEDVGHIGGGDAGLQQPVIGARADIEEDVVLADLQEVP